jgi:hypothetical protein
MGRAFDDGTAVVNEIFMAALGLNRNPSLEKALQQRELVTKRLRFGFGDTFWVGRAPSPFDSRFRSLHAGDYVRPARVFANLTTLCQIQLRY